MCIGWAVMFFRRLKKPVCTAENHGLQTGYYQYNNFFGAAFAAGCIHCEKGNFNFPLTFFAMGSYHIAAPALRRLFSASEKVKLGLVTVGAVNRHIMAVGAGIGKRHIGRCAGQADQLAAVGAAHHGIAAVALHCQRRNLAGQRPVVFLGKALHGGVCHRRIGIIVGLGQACDLALLLQLRGGSALIRTARSKAPAHSRSPKRGKAQRPSMRRQCLRPALLRPRSAFGWRV